MTISVPLSSRGTTKFLGPVLCELTHIALSAVPIYHDLFKAMDDIGVVMTPFGDAVTVILVANSYVV